MPEATLTTSSDAGTANAGVSAPGGSGLRPSPPVAGAPSTEPVRTEPAVRNGLAPVGSAWETDPAETAFGRFADWTHRYQAGLANGADPVALSALETEGVQLATERRAAMHSLIQSDPRRALELAVPLAVREALPGAIDGLLENRVSGKGDFVVMGAIPASGEQDNFAAIRRTLALNGVDYRAFVYGARADHPTRTGLPVHGVAVDDVVAMGEPVRVLEEVEMKRMSREPAKEAVCGVSAEPVVVVEQPTPVEVGGQITWICRFAHAEVLNSQLLLAASQPGTGFLGDGGLAESPYTEGRKRVIMFRVAFSNLPTPDVSSNQLVSVHAGVDAFWRQNSYGKTELAALGRGSEIVQVTLGSPSTTYDGDAGALRSAVRNQATAQGIDLSKFDFDVTYTGGGRPSFDFGGLGYVGAPGSWVVGASTGITAHEMGHNLGNPHANFWDTGGVTAIGTGDNQEYGDPFDVMGGGSGGAGATGHYVSKFKWRIGWIPDADFPRITSGGTYRLYPHDLTNSSGLRGVRITKDASLEYFLEFRQLYTGNAWLMNGVGLRWGSPSSWSSQLIDTTPSSGSGKDDSAIVIGRTFSDTVAGVHITPVGKGHTYPESIDVVVQLGAQAGNQPPVALVSASATEVGVGVPVTFTATASDPNGDRLAYYWEFSDSASHVSMDNSPVQSASFGTAGEYVARCVVSDMRGGIAQHSVVIRVGTPSVFRISGHVVDNLNRPLAGIAVTAAGPATRTVFSDSDGSYVIPGLSAGSYAVSALERVADAISFVRPYFSSPVAVGPSFTTADFVGIPGSVSLYTALVPKNAASWRYNDTGTDLGTAWRASAFADSAWATGTAPLGYPSGTPVTTVVGFGASAAAKNTTTYFRRHFTVANPSIYTNLLIELLRDDGAVVYLNGVELTRDNLPAGAISYATLASANSGADAYIPTTVPVSALVAGDNVLAVEVHQINGSSSDIVMDCALSGLSVSNVTGLKLAYLAEPANGRQFTSPATITLRAAVQTGGAAVTRVDYFADGVKIGESAVSPYTIQWSDPANGTHVLTANAIVGGSALITPPVRVVVGPPVAPPATQQLIPVGSTWRYLAQATAASSAWATLGFNDAGWPAGAAELGFGDGDEATVVPGGPTATRFATIYFRRSFVVDDPAAVETLTAALRRDDGAVIYLNGTEVARDNIAAGTVTYATLAAGADDDGATTFSHVLPATSLVHGTNVLAVEVHQSSVTSTDLSFELGLSAVLRTNRTRGCWVAAPLAGSTIDLPGALNLTAEVVAGNGLRVTRVEFFVDGAKVGEDTTAPFAFSWSNPSSGAHVLTAVATDGAGQVIASEPVAITVNAPPLGTALISFGEAWKYRDDGANLGATWTARNYNDSSWSLGASKLGYGTPSLATSVSFGPSAADKHITTYFRRAFNVPSVAGLDSLLLRLVRDDGAVVYLNGLPIYRDNLQAGVVSWNSTALTAIGSPADATPVDVVLPLTGLTLGSNVVSVEMHQVSPSSSDLAFNLALIALVRTNPVSGIYLASPAQGARYATPTSVQVSAQVAGASTGPVEFFANGIKIGEDSTAPYEFNWAGPAVGIYAVTARASVDGVVSTTPAVTVYVAPPPPQILPVNLALLPAGASWRYLDSATAPASDWNQTGFNDASWPSGAARFGHGLDGEVTALTPGRTTHYFRRWFTAVNPVQFTQLLFQLARDDGAVVYLNGFEVFRSNIPDGPVNAGTLAISTINAPEETEYFEYNFASIGAGLVTGSNLVAVELHQSAANSSDAGFDLSLFGRGTTEPRAYLGSPVQSSTVTFGRTVPIEAFASVAAPESVALVEFFVNGNKIGEDSTAPYRLDWALTEFGVQSIVALVTTSGGSSVETAPVSVTVAREAVSTQFIAAGSTWKYLDDGSSPGTSANPSWAQPGANDAAWLSGAARFGYGGDGEVTTLRETRTDASRIITYYFRKPFTVQPGAVYTNLQFNLQRDDGAIVYLNGREVYRSNLPAGTIGSTTLASASVGGADEQTFFPTSVAITNLPAGNNVVAVEVHQQATTSSDVGFDLSLVASGYVEDTTPPRAAIVYRDGLVEVSWPATFVGWRVYAGPGLAGPWAPLGVAPFVVAGRNVVTLSPGGAAQYFRIGKP